MSKVREDQRGAAAISAPPGPPGARSVDPHTRVWAPFFLNEESLIVFSRVLFRGRAVI